MKQQWTGADLPDLTGKRAIVTGTGGLGLEVARCLAGAGCEVILAGRNAGKGGLSVKQIQAQTPGAKIRFETCDLADLSNVADFANRMKDEAVAIDILVNNAGVMAPPKRLETADGFEIQLGTNYLGHFALSAHLLGLLRSAKNPRVVNVASLAHRQGKIHFDDLQHKNRYKPWQVYGQSKLAMLMFGLELQRQSDANGWGITSCPAHPGVAKTELVANGQGKNSLMGRAMELFLPLFSQSAKAGALPIVYAAGAPDAIGGTYYGPSGRMEMTGPPAVSRVSKTAQNPDIARRLWNVSKELTGVSFT